MSGATCNECGGRVVLSYERELVCTACGLVQPGEGTWNVREALAHSSPTRRVGIAHAGSVIGSEGGLSLNDRAGLLSPLSRARLQRLKRLQQIQPRMGRAEGVVGGERALMRACTYLGLPSSMLWRALHLYRRALSPLQASARQRVPRTALAAACLAAALLSSGNGAVTSKEVLKVFRAMGHRVNFNNFSKAMVYIKRSLGLSVAPRHAYSYLPYIVEEALSGMEAEVRARVLRRAKELLDKLSKRGLGGRAPRILAAAAVYAASKIVEKETGVGKLVTQKVLSRVIGVAEFSVRTHYLKFFKPLLEGGGVEARSKGNS